MMRPRFDWMCTCGHLGTHHHYEEPFVCLVRGGECSCEGFRLNADPGQDG